MIDNVDISAQVYTDEYSGYKSLTKRGYKHGTIPHWEKVYVMGDISTNTIEGFWGNFKTGTRGAYKHMAPKYLQLYVNEYAFRYNRRNSDVHMFNHFMAQVKQLDWWVPYAQR